MFLISHLVIIHEQEMATIGKETWCVVAEGNRIQWYNHLCCARKRGLEGGGGGGGER